jgi:hypothetical protein
VIIKFPLFFRRFQGPCHRKVSSTSTSKENSRSEWTGRHQQSTLLVKEERPTRQLVGAKSVSWETWNHEAELEFLQDDCSDVPFEEDSLSPDSESQDGIATCPVCGRYVRQTNDQVCQLQVEHSSCCNVSRRTCKGM